MGDKQRAPGHHASAVNHHASAVNQHGQAAHDHRESSRYYQLGKDYAHAAHMALTAHGHALKAIWHGDKVQGHYEDLGTSSPKPFKPIPDNLVKTTRTTEITLNSAEHHAAAANDHENAARHHSQAALDYIDNDHEKAAYEANIAHGYARHAIFHGDEAAKHHVEHYGKSGPTAEILRKRLP